MFLVFYSERYFLKKTFLSPTLNVRGYWRKRRDLIVAKRKLKMVVSMIVDMSFRDISYHVVE